METCDDIIYKYGIDTESELFSLTRPAAVRNDYSCYIDLETNGVLSEEDVNAGDYHVIYDENWVGADFVYDEDSGCVVIIYLNVDVRYGMLFEFCREYITPDKTAIRIKETEAELIDISDLGVFNHTYDDIDFINMADDDALTTCLTGCFLRSFGDIPNEMCSILALQSFLTEEQDESMSDIFSKHWESDSFNKNMESISGGDMDTLMGKVQRDENGVFLDIFYWDGYQARPYSSCYFTTDGSMKYFYFSGKAPNETFSIEDIHDEQVTGSRLMWYKDVLNSIPQDMRGAALISMLTVPLVEKGMKSIFKPVFLHFFERGTVIRASNLIYAFPSIYVETVEDKKISFTKAAHIGKKQADVMIDQFNKYAWTNIAKIDDNIGGFFILPAEVLLEDRKLKNMNLNIFNIYYTIDPELLKKAYEFFGTLFSKLSRIRRFDTIDIYDVISCMKMITQIYGINRLFKMGDYLEKMCHFLEGTNIYRDYLNMAYQLNMHNRTQIEFKTGAELREAHDEISYIYNMSMAKFNNDERRRFQENCKRAEQYVYYDDRFLITVPKQPEELVKEGLLLKHCVRSYIKDVADGNTNILFLRKRENENQPFFTIELTNKNIIRQVHGLQNRNISTEPEAETFFKKWVHTFRFLVDDYDQTL